MTDDISCIAENPLRPITGTSVADTTVGLVIHVTLSDAAKVPFKTLYEGRPVVVTFLRRFGCKLCRYPAKQLSTLKDELDSIGVSLVAICLEELGLADFVDGKFFAGDLFLDVNKGCYKGLKFERKGITSGFGLLDSRMYAANKKAGDTPGNLTGDGFQLGGTFIIDKGGRVLLAHRQQYYGHEVPLNTVRKTLGLEPRDGDDE